VHIEARRNQTGDGVGRAPACRVPQAGAEPATAGALFDATLSMHRRELSAGEMRRMLLRYPLHTARVLTRIYGQALRLKLKGAPYFPHPARRRAVST
jgi:DUF1365 family protein